MPRARFTTCTPCISTCVTLPREPRLSNGYAIGCREIDHTNARLPAIYSIPRSVGRSAAPLDSVIPGRDGGIFHPGYPINNPLPIRSWRELTKADSWLIKLSGRKMMAISSIMGRPRGTVVNRTVPGSRSRVRAPVIVIDVDHSLHLSTAIHTGRSAMSPPMYIMYFYTYIYIYLYQFVRSDPFPGHAMVGRLTPEVVPTRYCLSCISVPSHRLALICELPIASLKNESNSIRVNSLIFPISPIFKILCIYLPILVVDRF